jgi:phosphoribosylamine--glycine ligase
VSFLLGNKVHENIRRQRAQRTPSRIPVPGMQCLVVGSGGREHAIAWRLLLDRAVGAVDVAPGNGGTSLIARNIDNLSIADAHRIAQHAMKNQIDLAVVGPDDAIAAGVADELRRAGVPTVGPSREAAKVEWSKSFAKEVMEQAGVPTPAWWTFDSIDDFAEFARDAQRPLVIKADGLAAGKGVVVAKDRDEALAAARAALEDRKFGDAGKRIVVEECLKGEELSLHALVDGDVVAALPTSRDYKRAGDGDSGANTGGMGAYSPSSHVDDASAQSLVDRLIAPVARELAGRGTPYRGILYAGVMLTEDGPYVLEYNARFGDPEAQVVLPRIGGDFSAVLLALAQGRVASYLDEHPLELSKDNAVDVVVAATGYPAKPTIGERIEGLFDLPSGTLVFHAGTKRVNDTFVTTGGRVVHVVGRGASLEDARDAAYRAVERITFPSAFHRSDIAAPQAAHVS